MATFNFSRITERLKGVLDRGVRALQAQVLMKSCCRGKLTPTGGALILGLSSVFIRKRSV